MHICAAFLFKAVVNPAKVVTETGLKAVLHCRSRAKQLQAGSKSGSVRLH